MNAGSRLLVALLRLLQHLPLQVQAVLGRAFGATLHTLAGARRRVALRSVELCFPHLPVQRRRALVREHFGWLGRSLLERGLLWYAPPERLKRLIRVEGDVGFAERSDKPVMWLVPHFVALDAAFRQGRERFGKAETFSRKEGAKPLIRAIRQRGLGFFNLPDMDFGPKDAAFVPFFGVPAATLLAPSRMAQLVGMAVQPVVAEILPGGEGYLVRVLPPWDDFPSEDVYADTLRINQWIESEIRHRPAQYLWVHKRFKTRPPGDPPLY